MRYWEFSITNKFDNKNVLASCWRCRLFCPVGMPSLIPGRGNMCLCFSKLGQVSLILSQFCQFYQIYPVKHIKQRFSLRCKKKILNVLLPYDYVFCLSYEFRELPDNFLTNLENDFFWSMMEFFNISICFYKKKSNSQLTEYFFSLFKLHLQL